MVVKTVIADTKKQKKNFPKSFDLKLCGVLCCSAWSSSQEGGGGCPQLHCPQSGLEASPDFEAARPDQRLPAGLLQARERGASRPAGDHGCFPP